MGTGNRSSGTAPALPAVAGCLLLLILTTAPPRRSSLPCEIRSDDLPAASEQKGPLEAVTAARSGAPEGMVPIPGGTFLMGIDASEIPALAELGSEVPHMSVDMARDWFGIETPEHRVVVEPFFMDTCEVTNREYAAFVEATGYEAEGPWHRYYDEDRLDHPVVEVSWHDALAYAEWAGKRLPTEAEWEYAARGGRQDVSWFPWGDTVDTEMANWREQGESFLAGLWRILGLRPMGTMPVGSHPPNGYRLQEMIGNVSEWCSDRFAPYPGGPDAGIYHEGEDLRMVRGGHWQSPNPVFIRLTARYASSAGEWERDRGFRCAADLPASAGLRSP